MKSPKCFISLSISLISQFLQMIHPRTLNILSNICKQNRKIEKKSEYQLFCIQKYQQTFYMRKISKGITLFYMYYHHCPFLQFLIKVRPFNASEKEQQKGKKKIEEWCQDIEYLLKYSIVTKHFLRYLFFNKFRQILSIIIYSINGMTLYVLSLILLTFSHSLSIHTISSSTPKSYQQLLSPSLIYQYQLFYPKMPSSTTHNFKSLKQWQHSIIFLHINQTQHWICFFTVILDIWIMCVDTPNISFEEQFINLIIENNMGGKKNIVGFISDGLQLSHVKTAFIENSILKFKEFIKIIQLKGEISKHELKNHNLIDKLVIQLSNFPETTSPQQNNQDRRGIRMLNQVSFTFEFNSRPSKCWFGCNSCNLQLQICVSCQSGYQLSEGQFCKPNFILIISSFYLMFGFGTFHHAFVADLFLAQFSYQEYFAQISQLSAIYQFVGNVNREKIAPYYLKVLLEDLFKLLRPLKYSIISQQSTYQTGTNFSTRQQSPAHYTSNVLYILLINLPILVIIFMFLKLISRIATKLGLQLRFLTKNSSLCGFLLILLQTNGQYLTFMFWKQIIIPSFTSITDKFNLIFCLVFTFFIFTLCISLYPFYHRTYSDYKIQILFPLSKQHNLKSLAESIFFGPNRYILIGSIHSIDLAKPIKLILLVSLNILCIFFIKNLPSTYSQSQIFYKRIYFLLVLGINFTHLLTFVSQPMQFYNSLRFLLIIIIISLIAVELFCFLSNQLISKFDGFFKILTSRRTSRVAFIDQKNSRPINKFKSEIKPSGKDSKKYNS